MLMSARLWVTQRVLLSTAPDDLPWICAAVLSSDFAFPFPTFTQGQIHPVPSTALPVKVVSMLFC